MNRNLVVFLCTAIVLLGVSSGGHANHIYDKYGKRGYFIPAQGTSFPIAVTSTHCKPAEIDAFNRVDNSTENTKQLQDRWPYGINFYRNSAHPCDGKVTKGVDVKIAYSDFCKTHGCGTFGGENHSVRATQSFCDYWGMNHPCGSHPSRVHINLPKWKNTSILGRQRLIMHETGHSLGLAHHCSSDSIMNNGKSSCNGGAWTSVMKYKATDRKGVYSQYPCWKCS